MSPNDNAQRRLRRWMLVATVTVMAVLAGAAPVAAHGGSNATGPANYRSDFTNAGADGLQWRVLDGDGALELTNMTGADVIVLGYQGEPYLRFTSSGGVQRNTNSPATYLNEDRYGDSVIPPGVSASADPVWETVSTTGVYAWHDHRAHWMSRTDPPIVTADPDQEHLIATFAIPVVIDDGTTTRAVEATGQLRWIPDVAWWPPVLTLTAAFLAATVTAGLATRPDSLRWTALGRTVTAVVGGVIAANAIRIVDDIVTLTTAPERTIVAITGALALTITAALCIRGWQGHPRGFAALIGAAMLIMLFFGGEAFSDLSAPQLVTSLPDWVRRWTIAASYAVIVPAAAAAILAGRWYARTRPDAPAPVMTGDAVGAVTA